jgi:sirohydrochlorin cobaltochelatase
MSASIILFAHGAREPEWARPFENIRDRIRADGTRVELAYLELMSPSLDEAAAKLAQEGYREVTIVPLFLAQGGHVKRDLPKMVAALSQRHADCEFQVTPPLGEVPEIIATIAAWVQRSGKGEAGR